ncbi:MAG: hypothetical protein HYU34_02415 [Candidatus Omnitrophica bacterium]|nr:hypothetical protein [Candidatus Omnitrophota bacterium]
MEEIERMLKRIEAILSREPAYKFEAYTFVMAGLHYTVARLPKPRHVTGRELAEGLRDYALDQFGPMARTVLEYWGIKSTLDFGKIVFLLIEVELLRKTEEDSVDDFKDVYDFNDAFRYVIKEE